MASLDQVLADLRRRRQQQLQQIMQAPRAQMAQMGEMSLPQMPPGKLQQEALDAMKMVGKLMAPALSGNRDRHNQSAAGTAGPATPA